VFGGSVWAAIAILLRERFSFSSPLDATDGINDLYDLSDITVTCVISVDIFM
jgi:hypothetical protein